METRRWCLSCFEDFAEDISEAGLCMACDYEHDRAVALGRLPFGVRNDAPTRWWGPNIYDLDITTDDILNDGFHDRRGRLTHRGEGESWGSDGAVRDAWIGGAWRGCHACGELFQEIEWPGSPRCEACEGV